MSYAILTHVRSPQRAQGELALDESASLEAAAEAFGLSDLEPLARGGQKLVSTATRAGEQVVLKVVLLSDHLDPNALERCEREVALLQSLNSPNLVRVLSDLVRLGETPDAAAWLETFLDGSDLKDLLQDRWSWEATEAMMLGLAAGLSAMHENGYVHRDLSAGNVRRTSAGVWTVMDPGFAKHLNRTSITGLWQPGTPGYLSPEHGSAGGRITPASDVFCVGNLAHWCLVGSPAIEVGRGGEDYRQRLLTQQPMPIRAAREDVPEWLAEIIDRCLRRQPARRFLNAGELLAALQSSKPKDAS
jgi:serine/threonine-protein kinase